MLIVSSIFNSKKNGKRFLGCVCVIAIVGVLLTKLSNIMEYKKSYSHYQPFFEKADDFDVLFFGSSHMEEAVFPMELWNDYGITSYNLASSACKIPNSYWVMVNALDYTKPKVVVIDCFAMDEPRKTSYSYGLVHRTLDAFPMSRNKIRAIFDLLDDPEMEKAIAEDNSLLDSSEERTPIGLIWNYSVYHSRWNELNEEDFVPKSTEEYGAYSSCSVYEAPDYSNNSGKMIEGTPVGMDYLTRMINTCRERDIQVILTFIPYFYTEEDYWNAVNTAPVFAKKMGVDFVDMSDGSLCGIDPYTDYADKGGHLNPSGAWKITDYFGKYLRENYNIQDHRNEAGYSDWNEEYSRYSDMKIERLGTVEDMNAFLMLLEDKSMGYHMYVPNEDVLKDKVLDRLLENKAHSVGGLDKLITVECAEGDKDLVKIDVFSAVDEQKFLYKVAFKEEKIYHKDVEE